MSAKMYVVAEGKRKREREGERGRRTKRSVRVAGGESVRRTQEEKVKEERQFRARTMERKCSHPE